MLQLEHSAILLTCIKLSLVITIFVLSILSGRLHRFYCMHRITDAFVARQYYKYKIYVLSHVPYLVILSISGTELLVWYGEDTAKELGLLNTTTSNS